MDVLFICVIQLKTEHKINEMSTLSHWKLKFVTYVYMNTWSGFKLMNLSCGLI